MIQKKICLLGDFAVGKTSLIRRFVEGIFDDRYLSTIGATVSRKVISLVDGEESTPVALFIWDLVGGEKFDTVIATYYQGAAAGVMVCDLTRPETLVSLAETTSDFLGVNPRARLLFVGNKVDLVEERRVDQADLTALASRYHAPCFVSSAKTGQQVQEIFEATGRSILQR